MFKVKMFPNGPIAGTCLLEVFKTVAQEMKILVGPWNNSEICYQKEVEYRDSDMNSTLVAEGIMFFLEKPRVRKIFFSTISFADGNEWDIRIFIEALNQKQSYEFVEINIDFQYSRGHSFFGCYNPESMKEISKEAWTETRKFLERFQRKMDELNPS